jgi:hypothetical protein
MSESRLISTRAAHRAKLLYPSIDVPWSAVIGFPGRAGAQLDAACRVRLGAPVWGEGWDRKWDSSEPRQPDCVEKL